MTRRSHPNNHNEALRRALEGNKQIPETHTAGSGLSLNILRTQTARFVGIAAISAMGLLAVYEVLDDRPNENQARLEAIEDCVTAVTGRYDNPVRLTITDLDLGTISQPTEVFKEVVACNQTQADPVEAWDILGTPIQHRPAVEVTN